MKGILIGIIIILVLLLVLVLCIYLGIRYLSRKLRSYSRSYSNVVRGADMIVKGIQSQEAQYNSTPLSVSGMTSVYLPQIMEDFPEFHLEEMRERAEGVLSSYLQSIQEGNQSLLTEGTKELKDQLSMKIRALKSMGSREHYEQIKIHKTEIFKYRKTSGRCSIVFQSAVAHVHYVESNGRVTKGNKNGVTQQRYNVEVSYIQDRDLIEDSLDAGHSLICPNCGGVITSLGSKVCKYCGSGIVGFNIRTWTFTDVEAVK